jgi:hypothetical protein
MAHRIAPLQRIFTLVLATAVVAALSSVSATDLQAQETVSIDLAFITHVDADLPEQDVYIEREAGSGEVWRVTKGDNDMHAQLYAAEHPVEHDPMNPEAIGPYPKGDALGFTVGEWLGHGGTGTYTCTGGEGSIDLEFTGLVPGGTYTMWHAFIAMPPSPESGVIELPLGARDGSESVFTASTEGRKELVQRFRPCLEMSDVWTTSMLALNYHSDGQDHGAHPGEFGTNAHIPLFIMLPNRAGR